MAARGNNHHLLSVNIPTVRYSRVMSPRGYCHTSLVLITRDSDSISLAKQCSLTVGKNRAGTDGKQKEAPALLHRLKYRPGRMADEQEKKEIGEAEK